MRTILAALAAITALILLLAFGPQKLLHKIPRDAPRYELTILATNDLHGHLDKLRELIPVIEEIREEREHVLLLDAGDIFRRGPNEDQQGRIEIELLNEMGYDAMALGNNEFALPNNFNTKDSAEILEETDAQIANIIKWADFPVLCANVKVESTDDYIAGTRPYIVEKVGSLDIGIIGVTSMKPANRKMEAVADKKFTPGDKAVKQQLPQVKEESDIQIVLSHAGYAVDKKMKDVSAVIGGDDHIKLKNYKNRYGVPITQGGGEENYNLSRLDLSFARVNGKWKLQSSRGRLY